jgi:hypothetical protein
LFSIGNDSKVDGLVNFEKLRMIAKEIRQVVRMTSANMDPAMMFRQRYGTELYKEVLPSWHQSGQIIVIFIICCAL